MTKKSIMGIAQQIFEAIDTGGFSVIKNRNGGQHIEHKQVYMNVGGQQQSITINQEPKGDKK